MSRWLRIVGEDSRVASPEPGVRHVPEHNGQFRFNFDVEPVRRIVLIPMDDIDGVRLHDLLFELEPVAAMDLRYAVRFDLPGTNRRRFFGDLEQAHTHYIREPIEWHSMETGAFALDCRIVPPRLFHEIIEREDGHILLLVPNRKNAGFMASALNLALTSRRTHGWRIEQAA